MNHDPGLTFAVTLTSSALSTAGSHELLAIASSGQSRVELLAIELQQLTTAPLGFGVEIFRGSTSTPAGAALTPAPMPGWPAERSAASGANGNSTASMSTAAAVRLCASGFEADSGRFCYRPEVPPSLSLNARFHIRVATPPVATAIAATLTFRETGKIPGGSV
jgi:hypothetical protein